MPAGKISGIKHAMYEMFLVVEGAHSFPTILLSKLEAFPFRGSDVDAIDGHVGVAPMRVVLIRRSTKNTFGAFELWRAHGWKLIHAGSDGRTATDVACYRRRGVFEDREEARDVDVIG